VSGRCEIVRTRTRLELECLEDRIAPAGNVTVTLVGGVLTISGDAFDNSVTMEQGPGSHEIVISSDPYNVTTINGEAGPVSFAGVTGNITVNLGDGNDSLGMSGIAALKDVRVDMGSGDNGFCIGSDSSIHGVLSVKGGAGADGFTVTHVTVGKGIALDGGDGDNSFTIDAGSTASMALRGGTGSDTVNCGSFDVAKTLSIDTGNGDSHVRMVNSGGKLLSIHAADGSQSIELIGAGGRTVSITGGQGYSDVSVSGAYIGAISINTGEGDSTVSMFGCPIEGKVAITTAEGNAHVSIRNCNLGGTDQNMKRGDVSICLDGGQSYFEMVDSTAGRNMALSFNGGPAEAHLRGSAVAGNLTMTSGSGSDLFAFTNTDIHRRTAVSMGDGNDKISLDGSYLRGSFNLAMGGGNDEAYFDAENRPGGRPGVFAGPVKVDLGNGDDYLEMGSPGDGGNLSIYFSSVLINGGAGFDEVDVMYATTFWTVEPRSAGVEWVRFTE